MLLLLGIFITLLGASGETINSSRDFSLPQISNSITGHVADDRRNPIRDLQVELLNDVDSVIQRTKTDGAGLFVFRRLTTGIFQVRVQTFGTTYVGQTKRIELARGRGFEEVDFVLAMARGSSRAGNHGAVFVQEVPEQARKQYERGSGLLQKAGQRNEGVGLLKKAVEMFPIYFDALELLGIEYIQQQDYERALPLLMKAVEINRRAYPSWYGLSLAQYNLKQLDQAVESMRHAIVLEQGSLNANLWLGILLRQTQKLDEAETYLKRADQLASSKQAEPHWQLALLFNQLKRYGEAAEELEQFLKIQPDSKDRELIKKLIERFRKQSPRTAKQ